MALSLSRTPWVPPEFNPGVLEGVSPYLNVSPELIMSRCSQIYLTSIYKNIFTRTDCVACLPIHVESQMASSYYSALQKVASSHHNTRLVSRLGICIDLDHKHHLTCTQCYAPLTTHTPPSVHLKSKHRVISIQIQCLACGTKSKPLDTHLKKRRKKPVVSKKKQVPEKKRLSLMERRSVEKKKAKRQIRLVASAKKKQQEQESVKEMSSLEKMRSFLSPG